MPEGKAKIVALDVATNTGICFGVPWERPSLAHHRFPSTGDHVGQFLDAAEIWAAAFFDREKPDLVVFEAPILPDVTSLITVRKLNALCAGIEVVAYRKGIECAEVQPARAKRDLTGNGRASKQQMVDACRGYGLSPFIVMAGEEETSDEADAFGVWLHAVRSRFQNHAHHWDPLFGGAFA